MEIENKALQYDIDFDIVDFEIKFRYVDPNTNEFVIGSVIITGTSFYKNSKDSDKRKVLKKRETAFKGSVQHFMRSLYNENLRKAGYWIFYRGFRVEEWDYFKVTNVKDSE